MARRPEHDFAASQPGPRIALLIDCENQSAAQAPQILAEAEQLGHVVQRTAYADWTKSHTSPWVEACKQHGIDKIQVDRTPAGKNTVDNYMSAAAARIAATVNVDAICFVTSDSDFSGAATILRSMGKDVFGIGTASGAYKAFADTCTHFITLGKQSPKPGSPQARKAAKSPPKPKTTAPAPKPKTAAPKPAPAQDRKAAKSPPKPKTTASAPKPKTAAPKPAPAQDRKAAKSPPKPKTTASAPKPKTAAPKPKPSSATPPVTSNRLPKDWRTAINHAIDRTADTDGWALASAVGDRIAKNYPSFTYRRYGFKALIPMLQSDPASYQIHPDPAQVSAPPHDYRVRRRQTSAYIRRFKLSR